MWRRDLFLLNEMKISNQIRYAVVSALMVPAAAYANEAVDSLPKVERDGLEFYLYEVSKDESLYGISKRFGWDIDELIAYNPEANGSLKKGFSLYYPTGKTIKSSQTPSRNVSDKELPELSEAKARNEIKTESPVSAPTSKSSGKLASQTTSSDSVPADEPAEAGIPVTLPDDYPIEEHPESPITVSRESGAPVDPDRELRLVLLVEDPASKRESEFSKGMLMALDAIKTDGSKVNLKIIQAPKAGSDAAELVAEIEDYQPELIFTTHEKNFPTYLLEYVNNGPTELVNVFDVKDNSFESNAGVIQMMTPSASFSKDVADFAASRFRDRDLVVIGTTESADEVGNLMMENWPGRTIDSVTPEMLAEMEFDDNRSYLLYVNVTTKNDINQILTIVGEKKEEYPLADISVFGRANWIVYADALSEKFFNADVYFPSRFYFETDSRRGKEFRNRFNTLYGHAPVKSFPMFSVTGYDEATYFLDALRKNGGDWNRSVVGVQPPLQSEIRLQNVADGGFVNPVCYVVRFAPFKMIDKMPLK